MIVAPIRRDMSSSRFAPYCVCGDLNQQLIDLCFHQTVELSDAWPQEYRAVLLKQLR